MEDLLTDEAAIIEETFSFDDSQRFIENINAFLDHMEKVDPEMSKILRAHISKLLTGGDENERRAALAHFHAGVSSDLDVLMQIDGEEEGQ